MRVRAASLVLRPARGPAHTPRSDRQAARPTTSLARTTITDPLMWLAVCGVRPGLLLLQWLAWTSCPCPPPLAASAAPAVTGASVAMRWC